MKQFLLLSIILGFTLNTNAQKKWRKEGVKFPPPICYGTDISHRSFVGAPDEFLKHLKSTQQKKSTINVSYIEFDEEPKAAFDYAVEIWEHLIASPVPINLVARWIGLEEGVLGSCGPYVFFENFDSAPYKDRYYPVALVEKLEGVEVTDDSEPDMVAQFNSDNENWYFGTDGQTPVGKYDFVSVVLHEIAHGLGFTGFFYEKDGLGYYGDYVLPLPGVFDEFVINGTGIQLVDTSEFENGSAELYAQFRSRNLYSKSATARAASEDDSYPRLFAPFTFDEGSSIYHLNENSYPDGDINSLMTPFFDEAEAIHDPGPFTMGIFADMGWDYTSIIFERFPDFEETTMIPVEAQVETDSEIDTTSFSFVFSTDTFATADTLQLIYSDAEDLFRTSLVDLEDGAYQYYLTVKDTSERVYYLPARAPNEYFEFEIGPDTKAPEAAHNPISFMVVNDLSAEVLVEATDNIDIASVIMEYSINNGETQTLILENTEGNYYLDTLRLNNLVDGDLISYQIIVTDVSSNVNQTILPAEEEYYSFGVDGYFDAVKTYINDFNAETNDFISKEFYVATEELFDNGALHSPHPYPSSDKDDVSFDFTAILKYPIIIDDRAMMSFREVVLVEPGETGSNYGDDDFWDYVIVEGSKTGTGNWFPLIDGYDSRANQTWLTNYDDGFQNDGNSNTVGRASYYIQREFNMTSNGNFQEGDIIFIRFRLFSDPYAHGWGWAIDDLKIQDPPTALEDLTFSPGELMLYPNPVKDNLTIKGSFKSKAGQLRIKIFNSYGQAVKQEEISVGTNQLIYDVDAQELSAGLYLATFEFESGQVITHKFVKQ